MQKKHQKPNHKLNRRGLDSVHYENLFDYHVNFRARVIYLNEEIEEGSLHLILKSFDELERGENPGPIRIEVSSYGGSVYDMLGIIGRIKASPCHIETRGFGKIMSAATFILAAGDERFMDRHSWFMMHQMSDWVKGKVSDMKIELEHSLQLERQMNKLYEEFSKGKTKAKTFEKLAHNNCYLNPEQVLKLGLVDKIIDGPIE